MSSPLKIEVRTPISTRANNRLRNAGYILGSICKVGEESTSIQIKKDVFVKKLNELGISGVFDLQLGKKRIHAMILEIDKHALTDTFLNITFKQVSLKEKIKMNVSVEVINTDNLEHENLIISMHTNSLPLIALPTDIPDYIGIDGTNLKGDDKVFVKDIVLPKNTTTDADPELLVLSIGFPKKVVAEEPVEVTEELTETEQ